jgi:hypothetical protein
MNRISHFKKVLFVNKIIKDASERYPVTVNYKLVIMLPVLVMFLPVSPRKQTSIKFKALSIKTGDTN